MLGSKASSKKLATACAIYFACGNLRDSRNGVWGTKWP